MIATGCAGADAVAGDRRLMIASLFIVSRRAEVPTFAYQLCALDAGFRSVSEAKDVLDRLASVGVLVRSSANFSTMNKVPVAARGDSDCYRISREGVRILRTAYRAFPR